MSIVEHMMSVNSKIDSELQKKITKFLFPLDREIKQVANEKKIPYSRIGFLKLCRVLVFVDLINIYVVGTNVNAGGMHSIYFGEDQNGQIARNIQAVFMAAEIELAFEKPFGLWFPRNLLELSADDQKANARQIAVDYVQKVIIENEKTERIVRINPIFQAREILINESLIFCLSPFSDPYNIIFSDHIKPVVSGINPVFTCVRADNIFDNKPIMEDIWVKINQAKIIISDLSGKNPNVFYETGIAHTVGKEVILITQSMDDVPFDLKHLRCIVYEYTPRGMSNFEVELRATLTTILSR